MEIYTPVEVAEMLKIPVERVRILIREKKLEGVKVGKYWRVTEKAIDTFMKQNSSMKGE